MKIVFVDASFLYAFAVNTDSNHDRALRYRFHPSTVHYTSEDIIKEALTVMSQRKGRQFSIEFFGSLPTFLQVLPSTTSRYLTGLQLFLNPKLPKDISLIDCISAGICAELHIKKILTFDRHFSVFGLHTVPS